MIKSWRTTLAGLVAVIAVGLYWFKVIDEIMLLTGYGFILGALGLSAKDGKVTGGTIQQ